MHPVTIRKQNKTKEIAIETSYGHNQLTITYKDKHVPPENIQSLFISSLFMTMAISIFNDYLPQDSSCDKYHPQMTQIEGEGVDQHSNQREQIHNQGGLSDERDWQDRKHVIIFHVSLHITLSFVGIN